MRNKNGGATSSVVKDRYNKKTYYQLNIRMKKEDKPAKEDIENAATNAGKSLNTYLVDAIKTALNGGTYADIKDLQAYARSAGCTEDEYIRQAIAEKMKRQDEEYKEEIESEKIY